MDFRTSPADEQWRSEIQAFLSDTLPRGHASGHPDDWARSEENWKKSRDFAAALGKSGWLTAAWPREFGGQQRPVMQQVILSEELSYVGAPLGRTYMGINMIGPTIMVHGTPEQKAKFLPPIARAEEIWCQGFSEPGSGSDLASLQTRAVVDGDDFVINGQKIWTSGAHRADWCLLGVRTDPDAPKHRGITLLLVDMKSAGISPKPIVTMEGYPHFCEVFFEDVRVPRTNMVGEFNRGWYAMTTTLDFERSGVAYSAGARRHFEQLLNLVRESKATGERVSSVMQAQLANIHIEIAVARVVAYRVGWMQQQGKFPNYEASMTKILGTELNQRLARLSMSILGLKGQLVEEDRAPLHGGAPEYYMNSLSGTIAAGTSEIQRNIIATRGLGLPRG